MAQTSSSSAMTPMMKTKLRALTPQPSGPPLKPLTMKLAEHLHQDVAGDHRDEQSQRRG